MTTRALVIRADAGTTMGSGHVMRCLALAQAWQDLGGKVVFLSNLASSLQARLEREHITVRSFTFEAGTQEDAACLVETARELDTSYVVVDGYCFGGVYQRWIKDAGLHLLFLDDNGHAEHYHADIVLNQNIHATESLYPRREPATRLLLGTQYALIRREFLSWRGWQRDFPKVARKVLVTMGGSDPDNVTLKVIHALELMQFEKLEVKVIVGGINPHFAELQSAAHGSSHNIQQEHNVTDMPALMAWADVAVSAGGSSCWELAFMGLPSVTVGLAENQHAMLVRLDQVGAVINLGWHNNVVPEAIADALEGLLHSDDSRRRMSQQGRNLVDSRGGERVVYALRQVQLHLRSVTPDDCRLVFAWANEPTTRETSFSSGLIAWETHVAWFERTLRDKHTLFWIAEDSPGKPVGQVRFALDGQAATISVSLDPACRGRGYGRALIEQASWLVMDTYGAHAIHAYIKAENVASERAFASAGYSLASPLEIHHQVATHMILERP